MARDRSVTSESICSSVLPTWRSQGNEDADSVRVPGPGRVLSMVSRNDVALQILGPRKSINLTTSMSHHSCRDEEEHPIEKPTSRSI
jgi:hypothetical protein